MQIHELNTVSSVNDADVLALDDGTMTGKVAVSSLGKKITEDATPTFTSGDSSTSSFWTAVTVVTSGLSLKVILNRITTMMKNVRFLYNRLGTTDIWSIGDGTVTGAISKLNTDLTYRDYEVTTGTTQYGGYYFANITLDNTLGTPVAIMVVGSESNRPAFVMLLGSYTARVLVGNASSSVTVRAFYKKS